VTTTGPIGSSVAGGGGAPPPVNVAPEFIFRPGVPPSGNVYDDWATLMTAYAAVDAPAVVWFDSRFAPIVLPAGAWSAPYQMHWRGISLIAGFSSPTLVTLADGFSLAIPTGSVPLRIGDSVIVASLATAAGSGVVPFAPTVGGGVLLLAYGGVIRADGDLPILAIPADPNPTIIALFAGGTVRFGAAPAVTIPANVTTIVVGMAVCEVDAGTFSGPGTLAGFFGTANPDMRVNAADQPGVGSVIQFFGTVASLTGYTAAPADWVAPPPVTLAAAVDRIAAALGPIP
jgi:hypothetical protein